MKQKLFAALVVLLALNSCGSVEGGQFDPSIGQEIETTEQNVMMFGFDWADVHLKNEAGNYCAEQSGTVLTTNTCDSAKPAQLFATYKMGDGSYQLCKRGLTYTGDDAFCFLEYASGGCQRWVFGHTVRGECLTPTNYKNGSPKDYRFVKMLLSYAEDNEDGTFAPWKTFGNAIFQSGGYLRTNKHYLTRNSAGVVVPDNYAGTPSQRWSWY